MYTWDINGLTLRVMPCYIGLTFVETTPGNILGVLRLMVKSLLGDLTLMVVFC